jgi:phosphatidylinositol alpha-1,6-mannosyltransferase
MERLLLHVYLELAFEFDMALCGPTGASRFVPASSRLAEISPRPIWRFLLVAVLQGLRLALRNRPEIVFAGSGVTALPAWLISKATGAKVVAYVHGLDLVARHPVYRIVFLPAIRCCDRVFANSESTRQLAIGAGIPEKRIKILHPGADVVPCADPDAVTRFRITIGAGDRPILLSVGRLTPRKGLTEFIEHSLPAIVDAVPDVLLLVIGDAARNAVGRYGEDIVERIRRLAREQGFEDTILMLGEVGEDKLHLAYGAAAALAFPIRDVPGDVEGFGMVAIEAAAHGVPTVAFRTGGVPDAVADQVSGLLIEPGRYDEFASACNSILSGRKTFPNVRQFGARFAWPVFGRRLRELMSEVAGNRMPS